MDKEWADRFVAACKGVHDAAERSRAIMAKNDAGERCKAISARVAELEAALRPFSYEADNIAPGTPDEAEVQVTVNAGVARLAAALLEKGNAG